MAKIKVLTRFAVVPLSLLDNKEISFKAKGIYAFIQSKPDEWDFSIKNIAFQCKEGVESIASALRELEKYGYLKREKSQDDLGHWDIDYILYDTPFTEIPVTENPMQGNPASGKPLNNSNKDLSKKEISNKEEEYCSFDEFWNLYGNKTGKEKCINKWSKLNNSDKQAIMKDIPLYKQSLPAWKNLKDPLTYLNGRHWEDEREVKVNGFNPLYHPNSPMQGKKIIL